MILASDYLRTWIIHEFGGVYVDVDIYFVKSINWLVDSTDSFFTVWDWVHVGDININIFGAKPKHPIIANILKMGKTVVKTLKIFLKDYLLIRKNSN